MDTTTTPTNDATCGACGTEPERRTCSECGRSAMITDCGHMPQPRPIASGRSGGTEMSLVFCARCANESDSDAR